MNSTDRVPAGPGPQSTHLSHRAAYCLPGGNTRTTVAVPPRPPYAVAGSGPFLRDADGHEVIDLISNYTATIHGNCHPSITAAAQRQLTQGASFGLPTAAEVELAERLVKRVPAIERIRFTNSGSEAVMMAVRAARAFTGNSKVIRFAGCYHGTYDVALAQDAPGLAASFSNDVLTLEYNNIESLEEAFANFGPRIAAVLIDLIPNRLRLRAARAEFAAAVRRLTQAHGALLIVDEIISFRLHVAGFSASQNVRPDLITLGKIIGGGFPVGAFGGRADVMDIFSPQSGTVSHGGTFNANPISMVAGAVALDLLTDSEIDRINQLGDSLRTQLQQCGIDAAGTGSLLNLPWNQTHWWAAYRAGVLLAPYGLACISTAMNPELIEEAGRRLIRAARAVSVN